jgi:ketosteroid isomerase-like protein
MFRSFFIGLSAVSVLCCAPSNEGRENPTFDAAMVRDSVLAVMDGINAAANAKDVAAFMQFWANSDSLIYTRSGRTFIGWDEVAANHAAAFEFPDPWHFEGTEVHLHVVGPTAAVATRFTRTETTPAGGAPEHGWFTFTATVGQLPEGWRVVQAHASYPPSGMSPRGEPNQDAKHE